MLNNSGHFIPVMNHPLLRPWLHGAVVAFSIGMIVLVAVTLLTPPPLPENFANTTVDWKSPGDLPPTTAPEAVGFRLRDYRMWYWLVGKRPKLAVLTSGRWP